MKAPRQAVAWYSLAAGVLVGVPVILFAQDSGKPAADSIVGAMTGLSVQQQLYFTWAITGGKMLAEFSSSVRTGGGLKRILLSFWYGEQASPEIVEKVVEQKLARAQSSAPFSQNPSTS